MVSESYSLDILNFSWLDIGKDKSPFSMLLFKISVPIFKSSEVYMLNLEYHHPELHLNKINIQKHFDQMKPKICNIIDFEDKNSATIQLTKC